MANRYKLSRSDKSKGGKASAKRLSSEQRRERARKAAYFRSFRRLLGIPK